MKIFAVLLLVLAVVGCGKGNLRQDPVWPVPFDAEYPTAEIQACGMVHDLGHALCAVERGQPYNQVKLGVYVYYKGTVKVASRDCDLDEEFTYDQTGVLPINIPGGAGKNCNITVTVQPKFPKEENGVKIHSLKGMLFIRVLEKTNKNWKGFAEKIAGKNFSATITMWVGKQDSDVEVNVGGCGSAGYKAVARPVDGFVEFEVEDVLPADMPLKTCTMEGYVRSKVFKDFLFNVLISKYDERMTPLPIPAVKIDGKKIIITADSAVSVIAVNDKYELSNEVKLDWKADQVNTVRLLTVSGRSVVGIWTPGKGWLWKN